ncbi:MAG TPA: hypothetical protein VL068_08080 [Microthrixaceae bacterium]|nr:hypothetical protein [Microthrixaceae bacterium]
MSSTAFARVSLELGVHSSSHNPPPRAGGAAVSVVLASTAIPALYPIGGAREESAKWLNGPGITKEHPEQFLPLHSHSQRGGQRQDAS